MTTTDSHWDDRPILSTGQLALFLGGSEDSFTGLLLTLISKAQATAENRSRLEMAFPYETAAWRMWQSMDPAPTFRELREALDAAPDGPEQTARELVARMREVRGHIEDMGDDERAYMLGALTGALERLLPPRRVRAHSAL